MRKISIISLVSIFFALTLVVINIAFVIEYKRQKGDANFFMLQRFVLVMHLLRDNYESEETAFEKFGITKSHKDKNELLAYGERVLEDHFADLIVHKNTFYLVPKFPPPPPPQHEKKPPFMGEQDALNPPPPPPRPFVEPPILESSEKYSMYRLWILIGVTNALLLLFFYIVFRKLLGLRRLKHAIHHFGNTKKLHKIPIESGDELGEIALEFNQAMEKIHLLKEARTLFLRNILHELKTPIMKGQILTNALSEVKQHPQLERIFERLETLLGEMVKIEKLSSDEWVLEKKEYRLVDVLDHAMDLLMSDTSRIHINLTEEAPLIHIDFELLSTAIKNLLDNALKHSKEGIEVDITAQSITVCSYGNRISEERLDFSKAFNRSLEGSTVGLGLGLYIANAIIEKHGFYLEYLYIEQSNYFTIHFQSKRE